MRRRDLVFGGACVAALATAEWLRPRETLSLLTARKLEDVIPERFGAWRTDTAEGIVQPPPQPGSLAATLYNETVTRSYRRPGDENRVMLVAAHGDSQSDTLQLHRPESCYPAVGFEIDERRVAAIPLGGGTTLPVVELAAHAGGRREDVLYWTRLGEYLPVDAGQQRRDRLRTAMAGFVADGVLFRASMVRMGDEPSFPRLREFCGAMLRAIPRVEDRAALIGTDAARAVTRQA